MTCSVDGCHRGGKLTRGMCAKHYRYWLDHTPPADRPVAPRFARNFWDSVRKTHARGCWVFTGPTVGRGHGMWGRVLAHRHSWSLANGPIPEGMWVLHHCDNPPCVNPMHLYLGTIRENTDDAVARGRNYIPPRKTVCGAGHPLAGENLRIVNSKQGTIRRCRLCDNRRVAAFARAKRAARRQSLPAS